jgi:putative transposase
MIARRAILIELPKDKCDTEYIRRLMALTNLAYRDYEVWVSDMLKNIQYQLYGSFKNFMGSLVFGTEPKRWFTRTWVPLKMLRIYQDGSMKGDRNAPVVLEFRSDIDFKRNVIRLRQVCKNEPGYVVEIPMPKWVIERVKEGGDIKYAMIGLKDDKPYLALVAERVVEPYVPSGYRLVVDVNAWNNGVAYGIINPNNKIAEYSPLRPNLRLIDTWYHKAEKLSKELGKLKRSGLGSTLEAERLRMRINMLRRKIYAYLRDFAQKRARELALKALRLRAEVLIDDMIEESRRELLEMKLPRGLRKVYLAETRRFVKLLTTQLQWYGVPYRFERLPSTVCPVCQHELTQEEGRTMVCTNCGFKASRDKVPMYWAIKEIHPGDLSLIINNNPLMQLKLTDKYDGQNRP